MFHTHSRTWPFGSKVLGVDDNFDVVGLEKSIVKAAEYEVLTGEKPGWHVDGMAKSHGKHNCVPAGACNSSHGLEIWPMAKVSVDIF
jgi:hypothetical protein